MGQEKHDSGEVTLRLNSALVTLIFVFVVQTCAVVYWGASLATKVENIQVQLTKLITDSDNFRINLNTFNSALLAYDARITENSNRVEWAKERFDSIWPRLREIERNTQKIEIEIEKLKGSK